jgi:hypothetical protein
MNFFITRSNFLRIAKEVQLTPEQLLKPIYKSHIFFLNKLEIQLILSVKQVLEDIKRKAAILRKSGQLKDTFTYVNEYARYSKYHVDKNCEALNSDFKDIYIPAEIKHKAGEEALDIPRINEFRAWMKSPEIVEWYNNDPEKFYDKMQIKFFLQNRLQNEKIVNKGIQEISNLSATELEKKIDEIISYSLDYCYETNAKAKILMGCDLRLHTYYATSEKYRIQKIPYNTAYTDAEVRQVLLEYHQTIKAPLINSLIDYYIISINEGLYFSKNIMEELEFKPCRMCVVKREEKTTA